MAYEKRNPRFWTSISEGDIISLDDEETLNESVESGDGLRSVDFTVVDIQTAEDNAGCEHLLLALTARGKTDITLMVTIFEGDVSVKSLFEDNDCLEAGSREEVLESGSEWIFAEPEDADDFDIDELKFAKSIEFDNTTYKMRRTGTASVSFNCDLQGFITEYDLTEAEDEDDTNTYLIIIEKYNPDGGEGIVSLYFGSEVNMAEIEVLKS